MLSARQRWWWVSAAALAAVLLTARLGWWQLDRAAQKLALQAAIDERSQLPPIEQLSQLAASPETAQQQHHRSLRVAGRFSSPDVVSNTRPLALAAATVFTTNMDHCRWRQAPPC